MAFSVRLIANLRNSLRTISKYAGRDLNRSSQISREVHRFDDRTMTQYQKRMSSNEMQKDENEMLTQYEESDRPTCNCLRADCPQCGVMVHDDSPREFQCTWKEFLKPMKPKRSGYKEPQGSIPIQKRNMLDRPKTACIDYINREKRQLKKNNKFVVEVKKAEPKRPQSKSKSYSEMFHHPPLKKGRVTEKDYARSHTYEFTHELKNRIRRASAKGHYNNVDNYMENFMKNSY